MKDQIYSAYHFTEESGAEEFPQGARGEAPAQEQTAQGTPMIDEYGTDITLAAVKGALDPVVAREEEVLRIAQILCRRKKNNPIIIGEPGVGKSAIVEGLAQKIAERRVPPMLSDKRIVALEMASIVAGTQYRGQFEARIKKLIEELRRHPEIILFIDEIHTIIGAGSAPGSLDAANILKPALARGEVQCIGATTLKEYRKSIEKDGALERRFQKLQVSPTSPETTLAILRNIKGRYEEHHGVCYTDDALSACVDLSLQYITDRAFPDKAIDLLDEAGSSARLETVGVTPPAEIQEKEILVRKLKEDKLQAVASQDYELAGNLRDNILKAEKEVESLMAEWQRSAHECCRMIDADEVARTVARITGIPVHRLTADDNSKLKNVNEALHKNVVGQRQAIERVYKAIVRSRLGLKDEGRPVGAFLFVGPTGVGKTHLVKTLATEYFGSPDALIRVDMSEFGEKHTTSRLVGAPPGYVGYDEGGQLTERVRRRPYSVVLFDEIEKAHPDVFNMLLQVMDEGHLTDGNGVKVDFRNSIIVLTSNCGTAMASQFSKAVGFETEATPESEKNRTESLVMKQLQKTFPPEFLGRLDDVILFDKLSLEDFKDIVKLQVEALVARLRRSGSSLSLSSEALDFLATAAFEHKSGARALRTVIQTHIEDPLCELMMNSVSVSAYAVSLSPDGDKLSIERR